MLKIRVASDLHLEWNPPPGFLPEMLSDPTSVLILAGDIHSTRVKLFQFLEETAARFKKVLYIPGNHEFYGHDINEWDTFAEKVEREIPNCAVGFARTWKLVEVEGVTFALNTLWSNPVPFRNGISVQGFSDFRFIRVGGALFKVCDYEALHKASVEELENVVLPSASKKETKLVLVTHHLPSLNFCDPRYSGNSFDYLFASSLERFFDGTLEEKGIRPPDLWVYGHTHLACKRTVHKTTFICNPHGYPREATEYDPRCFYCL